MKEAGRKSRSYYVRCVAAIVVAGIVFHLIQYKLYHGSVRALAISLSRFPREIGEWGAVSVGLDETIESVLNLEDFWSATYAKRSKDPVSVFIGYYADESVAKLHQPTVCYPGAGWTLGRRTRRRFVASSNPGDLIEMNELIVERGEERQMVLYWFHYPGTTVADPSISKWHRLTGLLRGRFDRSLVKVQIAVPVRRSVEFTMSEVTPFIRRIVSKLSEHLGPAWEVGGMGSRARSNGER